MFQRRMLGSRIPHMAGEREMWVGLRWGGRLMFDSVWGGGRVHVYWAPSGARMGSRVPVGGGAWVGLEWRRTT